MTTKFLYTLITPEGVEVLVGAYANDASAIRAIRRKHAADWLQLSCYPLQQRAMHSARKSRLRGAGRPMTRATRACRRDPRHRPH